MRLWLIIAVACTACGRGGFDATVDGAPDVLLAHGAREVKININNLGCAFRYL